MLVGFVLPKVMLKYYGSEINGLVSSITQFMTYFSLVEAGLASAAVYALYKPLAEKNQEKINEIVSLTKKFYLKSGTIFLVLLILLALSYPFVVDTTIFSKLEIFLLVLVIGASTVIDFFTLSKYRVLLTADQKVYVISLASIIYYIVNTIIIAGIGGEVIAGILENCSWVKQKDYTLLLNPTTSPEKLREFLYSCGPIPTTCLKLREKYCGLSYPSLCAICAIIKVPSRIIRLASIIFRLI